MPLKPLLVLCVASQDVAVEIFAASLADECTENHGMLQLFFLTMNSMQAHDWISFLLAFVCTYWCGCIDSLRPSDAYLRQQTYHHCFRQWLVAWPAPSHYQNQCWNIVNWTLGNKLQWNFNRNSSIFIEENTFENVVCEMLYISSRPQCVNSCCWEIR